MTFYSILLAVIATCQLAYGRAIPKNNLHLEPAILGSNITKSEFDQVGSKIFNSFDDIVYSLGGDLKINSNWQSDEVNAFAYRKSDNWYINLFGGLARRPEISLDGLLLVACHELGHHLAGYPLVSSWAATEGNSDYFAVHGCARRLWQEDKKLNALYRTNVHPVAADLCDERYQNQGTERTNLCYREMMAAESLASLLAYIDKGTISWEKWTDKVVDKTFFGYPSPQCRFETMLQSALCDKVPSFNIIPWNEPELAQESCHSSNLDNSGTRPQCWYKEQWNG